LGVSEKEHYALLGGLISRRLREYNILKRKHMTAQMRMYNHPMPRTQADVDGFARSMGDKLRYRAKRRKQREEQARKLSAQAVEEPKGADIQLDRGGDYSPGDVGIEQAASGTEQAG
jgi:hypothetical protein